MESNKEVKKTYRILIEIVFGLIIFMTSEFLKDVTYILSFKIISFALEGLALIDIILFYFFEAKKKFYKQKIKYIFIGALILIGILSFILYLIIGLVTGFYIAVFGGLVSYIISLGVVIINNKKNKSKK